MSPITKELQSFYQFADDRLRRDDDDSQSLDQLYAEWRAQHPSVEGLKKDVLAVRASLRDLENGETGRPIEEFEREFRQRNGL